MMRHLFWANGSNQFILVVETSSKTINIPIISYKTLSLDNSTKPMNTYKFNDYICILEQRRSKRILRAERLSFEWKPENSQKTTPKTTQDDLSWILS